MIAVVVFKENLAAQKALCALCQRFGVAERMGVRRRSNMRRTRQAEVRTIS